MALQQTFPEFQREDLSSGAATEIETFEPLYVPFKRGANMDRVIKMIKSARSVLLDAAPAAGKTTILPIQLSREAGALVILILPFEHLACTVYEYINGMKSDVLVSYVSTIRESYPESGLVITYAGQVVARWLHVGRVLMPRCYLLHDEAHESGAATAAIRMLGTADPNVISYVSMSATADAGGVRPLKFDGQLVRRTFLQSEYRDPWDVTEEGAPWGLASATGHTLIFEDDDALAVQLARAYKEAGRVALRWHSRISPSDLSKDICGLNIANTDRLVIIADSSFRSGYTLPVSTIIDSGKIRRTVVGADSKPVTYSRDIYEVEAVQSASRGGRIAGLNSVYWRPEFTLKRTIAVLEQADIEVFAVILTVLGYQLPEYANNSLAAEGMIPVDLHAAFDGPLPLPCLDGHALCSVTEYNAIHQKRKQSKLREVACVEPEKNDSSSAEWIKSLRADLEQMAVEDSAGFMEKPKLVLGDYIASDDLYDLKSSVPYFLDGTASIMRTLAGADRVTLVASWDDLARTEAVKHLLDDYNSRVIQMRGGAMAVRRAMLRKVEKHSGAVRAWGLRISEHMSQVTMDAKCYLDYVQLIAEGKFRLYSVQIDMAMQEDACCEVYMEQFDSLPAAVVSDRPRLNAAHIRGMSVPTISAAAFNGTNTRAQITGQSVERGAVTWSQGSAPEWYTRRITPKQN